MKAKYVLIVVMLMPLSAWATPDKCTKQVDGKVKALEMWGQTDKARELDRQRADKPDCAVRGDISELKKNDNSLDAGDAAVKGMKGAQHNTQ